MQFQKGKIQRSLSVLKFHKSCATSTSPHCTLQFCLISDAIKGLYCEPTVNFVVVYLLVKLKIVSMNSVIFPILNYVYFSVSV